MAFIAQTFKLLSAGKPSKPLGATSSSLNKAHGVSAHLRHVASRSNPPLNNMLDKAPGAYVILMGFNPSAKYLPVRVDSC
jgi:hypothetical protein